MGDVDRYPNYISGVMALSAANTFTTQTLNLPLNRVPIAGGRGQMMEFLWLDLIVSNVDLIADNDSYNISFSTGVTPTAIVPISDPDNVFQIFYDTHFVTSGMDHTTLPITQSLQSTDGFGRLVAGDRLHVAGTSGGMAAAASFAFRIYYRFVSVPLPEFLGIVQSQQG